MQLSFENPFDYRKVTRKPELDVEKKLRVKTGRSALPLICWFAVLGLIENVNTDFLFCNRKRRNVRYFRSKTARSPYRRMAYDILTQRTIRSQIQEIDLILNAIKLLHIFEDTSARPRLRSKIRFTCKFRKR